MRSPLMGSSDQEIFPSEPVRKLPIAPSEVMLRLLSASVA
jgi:hypothetical protein